MAHHAFIKDLLWHSSLMRKRVASNPTISRYHMEDHRSHSASIHHKGRGKWVFRYVSPVTGKRRNAGLGIYPEISIADAGSQARLMREQLAKGLDPLEVKKEEASKPAIPTVEIAARQVHEQLLPGWRNPKHGKQWISTLEQYAFPIIGRQPINAITPAHIASVLQPIWLEIRKPPPA